MNAEISLTAVEQRSTVTPAESTTSLLTEQGIVALQTMRTRYLRTQLTHAHTLSLIQAIKVLPVSVLK